MALCVNLYHCTGSSEIGGPHIKISDALRLEPIFQVGAESHKIYKGLISNFCKERFSGTKVLGPPRNATAGTCWRTKDNKVLCPGIRTEVYKLVISIPVILGIEVGDETIGLNRRSETVAKQPHWHFPQTIEPDSKEAARDFGVVYDLIGFILINMEGTHFTA